jgi:methionyl-tRNA synthetase
MSDDIYKRFFERVYLRVAKVTGVERHPGADKLYIETITLGGEERTIVSGLVPYYSAGELLNKHIILVYNLKAAKLRGVESRGMLLAAQVENIVEVIGAEGAVPGERITLEDYPDPGPSPALEITIDEFFEFPIKVKDYYIWLEGKRLISSAGPLKTIKVKDGIVR